MNIRNPLYTRASSPPPAENGVLGLIEGNLSSDKCIDIDIVNGIIQNIYFRKSIDEVFHSLTDLFTAINARIDEAKAISGSVMLQSGRNSWNVSVPSNLQDSIFFTPADSTSRDEIAKIDLVVNPLNGSNFSSNTVSTTDITLYYTVVRGRDINRGYAFLCGTKSASVTPPPVGNLVTDEHGNLVTDEYGNQVTI